MATLKISQPAIFDETEAYNYIYIYNIYIYIYLFMCVSFAFPSYIKDANYSLGNLRTK